MNISGVQRGSSPTLTQSNHGNTALETKIQALEARKRAVNVSATTDGKPDPAASEKAKQHARDKIEQQIQEIRNQLSQLKGKTEKSEPQIEQILEHEKDETNLLEQLVTGLGLVIDEKR